MTNLANSIACGVASAVGAGMLGFNFMGGDNDDHHDDAGHGVPAKKGAKVSAKMGAASDDHHEEDGGFFEIFEGFPGGEDFGPIYILLLIGLFFLAIYAIRRYLCKGRTLKITNIKITGPLITRNLAAKGFCGCDKFDQYILFTAEKSFCAKLACGCFSGTKSGRTKAHLAETKNADFEGEVVELRNLKDPEDLVLTVSIYDHDVITADDKICGGDINMSQLFGQGQTKGKGKIKVDNHIFTEDVYVEFECERVGWGVEDEPGQ